MDDVHKRCGAFAASLERVPASVRPRMRAQLAAVIAASFRAGDDELTAWARRSSGPHPLLPFGDGVARMESIVAGVARAADAEWAILGRAGAPAIIAAISLGAAADKTFVDLERAQLAAVELGLRFGLATMLGPHLGTDAPATSAVAGAVAACRMLGLDADKTTTAIMRAASGGSTLDGVIAAELAFDGAPSKPLRHARLAFAPGVFARLGEVWLASTIQLGSPADTAIEATREVFAQARAVRKRPLCADDVQRLDIETSIFGMRAPLDVGVPRERVTVRHAWDLTSAALLRVAESVDARHLFRDATARELATALVRAGEGLGLDVPPMTQIASDLMRIVALRSRGFDPKPVTLGARAHLTTRDGHRFSADRSEPEPPSSDRTLSMARAQLIGAAGSRRGQRIYDAIVAPRPGMKIRELLAMMV
jgi:hypothetical protein